MYVYVCIYLYMYYAIYSRYTAHVHIYSVYIITYGYIPMCRYLGTLLKAKHVLPNCRGPSGLAHANTTREATHQRKDYQTYKRPTDEDLLMFSNY